MTSQIIVGDCLTVMPTLSEQSVQMCVTSPPYFGLRDYGVAGQLGLEPTPDEFVAVMVRAFREVWRVLRDDGTLWLNLGDSYWAAKGANGSSKARASAAERGYTQSGGTVQMATRPQDMPHDVLKGKDLIGIPWRVAFALQADGWYLRSDIIWHKPNPMPESVTDRPTKSHEYVFLLTKSERYYYDAGAIAENASENSGFAKQRAAGVDTWKYGRTAGGNTTNGIGGTAGTFGKRNRRTVWTIATQPFKGAHFATMPPKLIEPCVLSGSRPGDTVLDPFAGAGTTGLVADRLGREFVGIELNPTYAALARDRITSDSPLFTQEASA